MRATLRRHRDSNYYYPDGLVGGPKYIDVYPPSSATRVHPPSIIVLAYFIESRLGLFSCNLPLSLHRRMAAGDKRNKRTGYW